MTGPFTPRSHPISNTEIAELSRRAPTLRFERTPLGALTVAPPTGGDTGIANTELTRQLAEWNRKNRLGYVFDSSTGFDLPGGALYSPDASWISCTRWEALSGEKRKAYAPICPNAVFELRSASDKPANLLKKAREYMKAGAELAVLIDPYKRTIEIFLANEKPRTFADPAILTFIRADTTEPLPGFTLDCRAIFSMR